MAAKIKLLFNITLDSHYRSLPTSPAPSLNQRQILRLSLDIYDEQLNPFIFNWFFFIPCSVSLKLGVFWLSLENPKLPFREKELVDKGTFILVYQIAKHCLRTIFTSSSKAVFFSRFLCKFCTQKRRQVVVESSFLI